MYDERRMANLLMMKAVADSVITVRRAVPEDQDFLFHLYWEVRAPEFAMLALPAEQKQHLILMQFTAQNNAYRAQFPGSDYVIVLQNGRPVGRLWIAESAQEFHLVDIALQPQARNSGIGTVLIRQLQAEARRAGKPVRSTVFRFNPGSLRFHQRLGFRIGSEDPMQFYMEWIPSENAALITA
ncbi:MAG: GNAT family N-acetyltransferase [Terriglobales bacterium]